MNEQVRLVGAARGLGIQHRAAQVESLAEDRSFGFIASTNSVDRYADIIEQNWELEEFWANPVLLWGHDSSSPPIGTVTQFTTSQDKSKSTAVAQLLPEGQDEFVDQIARLLKAKVLRAVSVGFLPTEVEDRTDKKGRWLGYRYLRSKLIELSIVSVPANPEAVQLARSLHLDPQLMRAVFAEDAPAVHGPTVLRRQQAEFDLIRMKGGI